MLRTTRPPNSSRRDAPQLGQHLAPRPADRRRCWNRWHRARPSGRDQHQRPGLGAVERRPRTRPLRPNAPIRALTSSANGTCRPRPGCGLFGPRSAARRWRRGTGRGGCRRRTRSRPSPTSRRACSSAAILASAGQLVEPVEGRWPTGRGRRLAARQVGVLEGRVRDLQRRRREAPRRKSGQPRVRLDGDQRVRAQRQQRPRRLAGARADLEHRAAGAEAAARRAGLRTPSPDSRAARVVVGGIVAERLAAEAARSSWPAGLAPIASSAALLRRPQPRQAVGLQLLGHQERQLQRLLAVEARVAVGVVAVAEVAFGRAPGRRRGIR